MEQLGQTTASTVECGINSIGKVRRAARLDRSELITLPVLLDRRILLVRRPVRFPEVIVD